MCALAGRQWPGEVSLSPSHPAQLSCLSGNSALQHWVSRAVASQLQLSSSAPLTEQDKTPPHFFFFKFKEGKSFKLGEYLQIVLTDPHIKCCGSFSAYILSFLTFPGKETVLFAFFPFPSPEAVRTRESYRSFLLCFAERIAMPPR